ncbi:uncharacterized protein LOC131679681 [Topomyia yanbarensis]|uniref:uncharacterized protein LOC131679681 n=1 Tax=Topomyia yanbarensis TaxID=2498891 RepID=UPI00273B367D|nr:uncharacterized protein LOC131679681 [Topomyia yanbarensis]
MPPAASSTKKSPSLKLLVTKLKDVQSSFDDIYRFVEDFKENTTTTQIEVRLEKLDELWEKFSDTLIELKSHDDYAAKGDDYEDERLDFSDRYYRAKSFLVDMAKERQEAPAMEQSIRVGDTSVHSTMDHVRLPQIKLQTFNGDIDEWLGFRDLFTSLIHWKADLPEVEKFHYLKGCLQGEPKSLIEPLQITRANYQVAWEMLLKCYNNSKQLKKRQVQSLFKLPALTRESVADLHSLLEGFQRVVQTLDQIVQPHDYKDLLLVNLLSARLDPITRRGWEEHSSNKDQDSLNDLTDFLHRRIQILEALPSRAVDTRGVQQSQPPLKPKLFAVKNSFNTVQANHSNCVACKSSHPLYQCGKFREMPVSERDVLLRNNSLCRNCFRQGHHAKDCQSKYSCRHCKGRHHTLVCFRAGRNEKPKDTAGSQGSNASVSQDNSSSSIATPSSSSSSQVANMAATEVSLVGSVHRHSSQVLLATAVVIIEDDGGTQYPARALLDSGSESNFISERLSQRLKVDRDKVDISILGIGQRTSKVKQRIQATVLSRVTDFSRAMSFLVLPKVTVNLPTVNIDTIGWPIPRDVELADPAFGVSQSIDIVLGIESFFEFFQTGRKIPLGERLPSLNESVFGWVVCGDSSVPDKTLNISCNVSTTEGLEELMARFWTCEDMGSTRNNSPEEARCEEQFVRSIQRGESGRYTVSLPKDEDKLKQLGDSRGIAFRRLQGTERRLERDAALREQYKAFMTEYVRLGHMQRVDTTIPNTDKRCYLPHHPVVKEASTTTKVRVVFDASCKTASGVSLNDTLLVGPVIQEDLRSIILRCRTRQIMLVADVEKMFRQINVNPDERHLQSILWRSSPRDEAVTYELNTVTYGTKPAPFLATRTLKQLAMEEEQRYPLAAKAISEDTYMDDVLTGSDNAAEALKMRIQLDKLMASGGFQLRKWASNCVEVLRGIPEENLAIRDSEIELDPDPSIKTLGLVWQPRTDVFKFQFSIPSIDDNLLITRRQFLSIIATLFDPLGLVGATITMAKLFMQQSWMLRDEHDQRFGWDQPLPSMVGETWRKYHQQLHLLNQIHVDRCVIIPRAVVMEFHCFSDASLKAYGACLYVRSIDTAGRVKVQLLTSKSKVAPVKCMTIPRLELCGAVLAAQLFQKVQQATRSIARAYFWTDSTCVLRWLQACPATWTIFVANRVATIQTITEGHEWRHVPGIHNPADLISRGISPEEIIHNNFWWNGPSWLTHDHEEWPNSFDNSSSEGVEEKRRRTVVANTASVVAEFNEWYLSKFATYSNLIRRTAIWLRLISLLRTPKKDRRSGWITTEELKTAEYILIQRVQREVFPDERKALLKGDMLPRKSPLRWFNSFVAEREELIRVGGRLIHSNEPEDAKHPIVLPARHRLTRMILKHYHERLLHAGPQLLLSVVRLRYWPLGGRNVARETVHRCQKCFRSKPTPLQQFMGDLPAARVTISRPFSRSGVDYFGPIYVRPVPRRAAVKAYAAIFVCLCTKAIHLELVGDLSTDRFLQALRRFVARRGRPTDIYSDNGTNFVGARNKLEEVLRLLRDKQHQEKVSKKCAEEGIRWHFSPPAFAGILVLRVHLISEACGRRL